MKVVNHSQLVQSYKGKWVVLDKNYQKVLSANNSLKQAIKDYKKKGYTDTPSVFKVPSKIEAYIG